MARFKETPDNQKSAAPKKSTARGAKAASHVASKKPAGRTSKVASRASGASARASRPRASYTATHSTTGSVGVQSYSSKLLNKQHTPSEAPKGVLIGIAIAALVIVVLISVLACNAINSSSTTEQDAQTAEAGATSSTDETITYHGYTYALAQDSYGDWTLTSTGGDGVADTLYTFEGSPVGLVIAGGKLFAPENKDDGSWDIVCYMAADGGTPYKMADADGNERTGQGKLASATLNQSGETAASLVLTDESGATTTIELS